MCLYERTCTYKWDYQPSQTLEKSKATVLQSLHTHDSKVINLFTEDHQALNHYEIKVFTYYFILQGENYTKYEG